MSALVNHCNAYYSALDIITYIIECTTSSNSAMMNISNTSVNIWRHRLLNNNSISGQVRLIQQDQLIWLIALHHQPETLQQQHAI